MTYQSLQCHQDGRGEDGGESGEKEKQIFSVSGLFGVDFDLFWFIIFIIALAFLCACLLCFVFLHEGEQQGWERDMRGPGGEQNWSS